MRVRTMAKIAAALSAAFLLAGCASWFFGGADTDGQTLYRKAGEYVYASIPVEIYVARADAEPGVVAAACEAEAAVYGALTKSMDSFAATGQRIPVGFLDIAKTSGVFAVEVFGALGIPDDPAEALGATKIMVYVGVAAMREYRRKTLRPKLNELTAAGRDPTPQEWAEIRSLVDSQHTAIAASCAT